MSQAESCVVPVQVVEETKEKTNAPEFVRVEMTAEEKKLLREARKAGKKDKKNERVTKFNKRQEDEATAKKAEKNLIKGVEIEGMSDNDLGADSGDEQEDTELTYVDCRKAVAEMRKGANITSPQDFYLTLRLFLITLGASYEGDALDHFRFYLGLLYIFENEMNPKKIDENLSYIAQLFYPALDKKDALRGVCAFVKAECPAILSGNISVTLIKLLYTLYEEGWMNRTDILDYFKGPLPSRRWESDVVPIENEEGIHEEIRAKILPLLTQLENEESDEESEEEEVKEKKVEEEESEEESDSDFTYPEIGDSDSEEEEALQQ